MPRKYTVSPERREAMDKRRLEVLSRYHEIQKKHEFRRGRPGAIADLARELGLSRERTRQLVRQGEALAIKRGK